MPSQARKVLTQGPVLDAKGLLAHLYLLLSSGYSTSSAIFKLVPSREGTTNVAGKFQHQAMKGSKRNSQPSSFSPGFVSDYYLTSLLMEPEKKTTASKELVRQLKADLVKQRAPVAEPTIFLVPITLWLTAPDHFQSRALHLGLHHRKQYSSGSEEFKVAVARALLEAQKGPGLVYEEEWSKVVSKVVRSPQDARKQYERTHEEHLGAGYLDVDALDEDAVANLLTLDALFVVAFLQVSFGNCKIPSWDDIFQEPRVWGMLNQMETELARVQNQVPMSCLKGAVRVILGITTGGPLSSDVMVMQELEVLLRHAVLLLYPFHHDNTLQAFMKANYTGINSLVHCKHILDCLYRVFSETLFPEEEEEEPAKVTQESREIRLTVGEETTTDGGLLTSTKKKHSLGAGVGFLCRKLLCSSLLPGSSKTAPAFARTTAEERSLINSQVPATPAKKLKLLGIEIRSEACRMSGISFVDRPFLSSLLVLPQLQLYDTTAAELRNLALYEFLAYPRNGHVRKYMRFMNDLITNAADAELVVRSGAISNYVGGFHEIVSIWSRLNQGISLPFSDPDMSVEIAEAAIRRHSRMFQRRCVADFRGKLFGRPTLFFSAIFGLILLLLTATQTYVALVSANKLHPG